MQATMSVSQLDNEALEIIGLALLCLTKIFFQIMFKRIVINSSFEKDHRSPVPTIWVPFSGLSSSCCSILTLVLRLRISKKLISSRAPRLHISRLNSKSKEISSLELRVSVVCTVHFLSFAYFLKGHKRQFENKWINSNLRFSH